VGKSHAASALGHALIEQGHAVVFRTAYQLVQELLAAKRDLTLPRLLRRLDTVESRTMIRRSAAAAKRITG
jgi:DNA replication protein DnaC